MVLYIPYTASLNFSLGCTHIELLFLDFSTLEDEVELCYTIF